MDGKKGMRGAYGGGAGTLSETKNAILWKAYHGYASGSVVFQICWKKTHNKVVEKTINAIDIIKRLVYGEDTEEEPGRNERGSGKPPLKKSGSGKEDAEWNIQNRNGQDAGIWLMFRTCRLAPAVKDKQ